jgi:hypothetical protein
MSLKSKKFLIVNFDYTVNSRQGGLTRKIFKIRGRFKNLLDLIDNFWLIGRSVFSKIHPLHPTRISPLGILDNNYDVIDENGVKEDGRCAQHYYSADKSCLKVYPDMKTHIYDDCITTDS